jgi:hypothetical protein
MGDYDTGVLDPHEKPLEENEFPDEADLAGQDDQPDTSLAPCPACGALIYDDAPRCPHCQSDLPPSGQKWRDSRKWYVRGGLWAIKTLLWNWIAWLIVGAVAALAAIWEMGK